MVCPVTSVVIWYFTDQIIKAGWFIFQSAVDLVSNIKKRLIRVSQYLWTCKYDS